MMRSARLFNIGSWILVALGIAHLGGHISGLRAGPANDMERQLRELMYGYKVNLMGSVRSAGDIQEGLSLGFSAMSFGFGLLNLLLGRGGADAVLLRRAAGINTIWLAMMTAISLVYWFAAPTSFLVAALCCFAAYRWQPGQK